MSKLAGKVAVVTGASKGIGAGIANALAQDGAAVVVNYASTKTRAEAVRLDVLVNNSGVYDFAAIEEITEAHYRKLFDVNVLGVLLATQAAARHLGEGGSIVNISSAITHVHTPTAAVYAGTKGALNAISGVLANELAPRRIRVNTVSPGYVVTEGTHSAGIAGSEMETGFVAQTPLGRAGAPDDIARVVALLASDDAHWLTGEVITASGGIR